MAKLLGIIGSPRKNGNTHILVEQLLAGARGNGGITETLFLNDLAIKECDGCHVCWNQQKCVKQDDMSRVYAKIIESDMLVFGTPVYWYGPTALMKGFIDRLVYFNCVENRSKIRGKKAVLIVPFEEEDETTVAPVISFFGKSLTYLEVDLIHQIIVPGVTIRGEVLKKDRLIKDTYNVGKNMI